MKNIIEAHDPTYSIRNRESKKSVGNL